MTDSVKKDKRGLNGKPFVKGDKRCGRPKTPTELHLLRQTTQADFRLLIQKLIDMRPEEVKNFKSTALEMAMASIFSKAIKQGDPSKLEFFLNRLYGKVPEKVETTMKGDVSMQVASMSDKDIKARINKIRKLNG